MKKLLLSFIALLAAMQLLAAPRSLQQARKVAQRYAVLHGVNVSEEEMAQSRIMPGVPFQAEPYYIFNNGGDRGFTIVSGDDCLPEIVGYATSGCFTPENIPVQLKSFLEAYESIAQRITSGDKKVMKALAESKALKSSSSEAVLPLLGETEWSQNKPYNTYCPIYEEIQVPVGCVATAMAQIMAYYKYPSALMEDIPGYTTSTQGTEIPGVSKGEKYDYDLMLPRYVGDYTEEQGNAVAKLMYHCGIAVNMDYNIGGSGALSNLAGDAMAKYFGYDADVVQDLYREYFTLSSWISIINGELKAGRPILYASDHRDDGGHAYVLDGADGEGLYHINWGWGGYCNGYFDITILNEKAEGSHTAPDGFNMMQEMVIGIRPDNGVEDVKLVEEMKYNHFMEYTIDDVRADASAVFKGEMTIISGNVSKNREVIYLAVKAETADGTELFTTPAARIELPGALSDGRYYISENTFDISYAYPTGLVRLIMIKSEDGVNFNPVYNIWTEMGYFTMAVTETELKEATDLTAVLSADRGIYAGMDNTLSLSVSNSYALEFLGDVKVYASREPVKPEEPQFILQYDIPAKGTSVRDVSIMPAEEGKVYVWVDDYYDHPIIEAQEFEVKAAGIPDLTLVKIETNVEEGLYELQDVFIHPFDSETVKVKLPVAKGDEVEFRYTIRNMGDFVRHNVSLMAASMTSNTYDYTEKKFMLELDKNEETTISLKVKESDVNSRCIVCGLYDGYSESGISVRMDESLPVPTLYVYNEEGEETGQYINFYKSYCFAYLQDASTGIVSAAYGNGVIPGVGSVTVSSDKAKDVVVYSISGQVVKTISVSADVLQTVALPAGIYVVEGKKIIVR